MHRTPCALWTLSYPSPFSPKNVRESIANFRDKRRSRKYTTCPRSPKILSLSLQCVQNRFVRKAG